MKTSTFLKTYGEERWNGWKRKKRRETAVLAAGLFFHLGQGYVLLRRTHFVFVEYGEGWPKRI